MSGTLRSAVVLAVVVGSTLGAASSTALAAGPLQSRLDDIDGNVVRLEQKVDALTEDFSHRRGLIGAVEARSRFEEAVYQYLIGQYEPAALTFYTLVDAEALSSQPLHQDAEWYLAECLFELGNYATAAEAYGTVVDEGPGHPFFEDGVRRLLEVYGLMRDTETFYDVYQRYIVTGRVKATPFVKYTVAKSLWRQGESARAKAMFSEVPPDAMVYMRSRYFLGAILADEGAYEEALAEFRLALQAEPGLDPSDAEVQELAQLAVARISYEVGDFNAASAAYLAIPKGSKYFPDQLYEQVWTYIKQEKWPEALDFLEMFLLGFPTHREAVNLKLTQGHLLMKENRRNDALVSYEQVVADYSPVEAQLNSLKYNREDPARYFRMLADARGGDPEDGSQLPGFAREILVDDPQMARAVEIYRSMDGQESDLQLSEALIEEVSTVLRRADRNIGTFARGRAQVRSVRDDNLSMRGALVGYELDYLSAKGSSDDRAELADLEARFTTLRSRSAEVEEASKVDVGRLDAWGDQIMAVQEVATRVLKATREELARARAIETLAFENPAGLTEGELAEAKRELAEVVAELERSIKTLDRLRSESTRSSLLAMVSGAGSDPAARKRVKMAADFAALRDELRQYRKGVNASDGPAVFARLDDLWQRGGTLDRRAGDILGQLDAAERSEIAVLRRRLDEETRRVELARLELRAIQDDAGEIATDVALVGFGRLEDEIGRTIEDADVGIVDVYWLDKTEVSDEIERLGKDRAAQIQALDDRFRVVRQKLEGRAEPASGGGN